MGPGRVPTLGWMNGWLKSSSLLVLSHGTLSLIAFVQELEAEQAQARKEAQEREARLQAEKEALSNSVSANGGEKTADPWLQSPWASATTFLGEPPSCTPPTNDAASSVNGAPGNDGGVATGEVAAAPADGGATGQPDAVSPKKEATGGPGSPMVSTRASSKSPQKEQQQDGKDRGTSTPNTTADAPVV